MKRYGWQIGTLLVSTVILLPAAGCTNSEILSSGNSILSFQVVTSGMTVQTYDCIQWKFGDLRVRPLDGTCSAADSNNPGAPCLNGNDCDPIPPSAVQGSCEGSAAGEVNDGDGIQVLSSPEAGTILGGVCVTTTAAGGSCDGLFEGGQADTCTTDSDCGFCSGA